MAEQSDTPTPLTRKRRQGQRMTKAERQAAQEKFLKSFGMTANVRAACMAAGIDRSTVYAWQEHDEQFSLRFKQAEAEANDILLAEAWRRGVQGYKRPVVSMGKQVYVNGEPLMEPVYSDNLLALLMKARMPQFREKNAITVNTILPKEYVNVPEDDGVETE